MSKKAVHSITEKIKFSGLLMVSPVINLIAESVVLYSLEAYQGISMMTAKDF
ncbi:hypothetical protein [Roseofilum sp. Guam]|uniref:hypothetical protein n=1 Tax=Roseofilum sp. Guam TaxID=2821502 RepID=UPI001B008E02|nr:hypothetical protein [Roseofilum sp. Guam]MBP0028049.1 hypothetical protein [Roseofilum sp. Guam]